MRKIITIFILLFTITLSGCNLNKPKEEVIKNTQLKTELKKEFQSISMEEAKQLMEEKNNYIILDVRTIKEYNEGHIPGSICIPNEEINDSDLSGLPDKKQLILVYCRSGNRSKQASEKLTKIGYTNIIEIGGIIDWTGEIETTKNNLTEEINTEIQNIQNNFSQQDIEDFEQFGHYFRFMYLPYDNDEEFNNEMHIYIRDVIGPKINDFPNIKYMGHQDVGASMLIYVIVESGTSTDNITQQAQKMAEVVVPIWYEKYGQKILQEKIQNN